MGFLSNGPNIRLAISMIIRSPNNKKLIIKLGNTIL
jgi:hypothetical protein